MANRNKCSFDACDNESASGRHIKGLPVCRACYQSAWGQAKGMGVALSTLDFVDINPCIHQIPAREYQCPRLGCNKTIPADATTNVRRRIGNDVMCRACYQATWEYAQANGLGMETAWKHLKAKKK